MTEPDELTLAYLASRPVDAARVLERLEPEAVSGLLADVPVRLAVGPLAAMVPWRVARCLGVMATGHAAAVVEALPAEQAPDCLRAMPERARAAILDALPLRRARALRRQLRYPVALVGAHMDPAPLALRGQATADEARAAVRAEGRPDALQVHVLDDRGGPTGAVRLGELLAAVGDRPLSTLMLRDCHPLAADLPVARVDHARDWTAWPERPVIDGRGRLVGAVTLARLVAAGGEPAQAITAGSGPVGALLQAYAATAAGLARVLAGLATARGGDRRGR